MRSLLKVFFLFSFIASYAQEDENYSILNLPQELLEKSNAVVRSSHTSVEIDGINSITTTITKVVTVLNKEGRNDVGAVVSYDDGITVKKLEALVFNQFGKQIQKYKKGDFTDESAVSNFSLYEDSRVKYMEYTPTGYPYTVKFQSVTQSSNTAYIPFWRPIEGYYVSTQNSRYEVSYDSSIGVNIKEGNLEGFDIVNKSKNGYVLYQAKNLKSIKPEAYSQRFVDFTPFVKVAPKQFYYEGYVGTAEDWKSIGVWMHDKLLKDRLNLPESTKAEIKALVAEVSDPIEKAKLVYKYVQDRTRYISVQEGIGGMQPILAEEVDRVKYGDCKGLTNYTKALLDVVGVPSNYTRLYASGDNNVDVDKEFVSFLGQTNHVILNLPNNGNDIWLECTSQTSPFGYIAGFTDDRDVIVITPEGAKIVHTKVYTTEENLLETKAKVNLDINGGLSASVNLEATGYQYSFYDGKEKLTEDKQLLSLKNYWDYLNSVNLTEMSFNNDKEAIKFTIDVKLSLDNYATKTGNRILFQPNALNRYGSIPTRYSNRNNDFELERGYTDVDEFEIVLDENLEVEAMPSKVNIESQFGSYYAEVIQLGSNKLLYKRKYVQNPGLFSKEDYAEFRSFRKQVVKHDKAKIALINKSI
ncbi:MAG: hypothetical protein BM564_08310 [Bacteroidetes bacterium MedPE-SWsnd-G2]|nr:MAG: hypothetical protein BM564_08310 [Bacteroidetes bacterium MedPE-SWsnd-G2]